MGMKFIYATKPFKSAGIENSFFIYVIVMLVICFFCSLQIPREARYLKDDH